MKRKIIEALWVLWAIGAVAGAVLLSGCETPDVPIHLTTSRTLGTVTEPPPEVRDVLDEAFGYWGATYTLSETRTLTAINLTLIDIEYSNDANAGRHEAGWCDHRIWTSFDPLKLQHELGHAFGLDHVEDPFNVMYEGEVIADYVTDWQMDDAHAGASALDLCR